MRSLDAGRAPRDGFAGRDEAEPRPARAFCGRGALSEALRDGRAAEAAKPKRRYRSWKRMGDDEMVGIAQEVIDRNSVSCRTKLWEVDAGLADRLRERGLWGRVRFTGQGSGKGFRDGAAGGGPAPATKEAGPAESKPAAEPFSKDDVVFLAQSAIDEIGIAGMGELARLDAELHNLVAEAGVQERLRFAPAEKAGSSADESGINDAGCTPGVNGEKDGTEGAPGKAPEGADGRLLGLSAEQLRKADLHGRETGEEEMFRLIFAECFRVGTGNPYLGSMRGTVPKLQSSMNRKLSGRQHRLFRKCWARMESEGVISYNHNRTAASVDIGSRGLKDAGLMRALSWASAEQIKVGPEWVAAFGADT